LNFVSISDDVKLGKNVKIFNFVNLYGCEIDDGTKLGTFVEVQRGAIIGKNCKISSHTFICEGVHIGDGCFIGHGVLFINDKYPHAVNPDGTMQSDDDWDVLITTIENNVSIGSGAIIMGGVKIGQGAMIGAGAVVTKDVSSNTVVAGIPARILKKK
jgi:acetyltransferase-like isoleucine patch superfamily enzyme